MSPFLFPSLPVIDHETGHFLFSWIYMLTSFSVITTYMVAGYRRKIPLSQLLLGAATFFLFFTLGSRLFAFTSGEWHQLLAHGEWPRAGKKSMLGGLTGLLAGILLYASWTRNSKRIFDVIAIVLPVGMSIQRITCLLSGCCSGIPSHLPWGIRYDQHSHAWSSQVLSGQITSADPCSLPVHPTQVYDIIAWVIIFFLSARAARYFRASGSRLLLTILLYGLFRFLLEFLRDPLHDFIPGSYLGIKYIQWMILAGLPLPALIMMVRERRAGRVCFPEVPEEEKFARHFILTLIVVSLFLMLRNLFNLPEMIALNLLLVSLFIITAFYLFRRNRVPGFRQGTILLMSGFIIIILAVSCAKSRFATTTRQYHDGKVTYSNHYSNERMKLNRHKTKRPAQITQAASAKTARNPVDNPEAINKMDVIASSDKNFLISNNTEKLISQYAHSLVPEFQNEKELTQSKHHLDNLTNDIASVSFKKISKGDTTIVKKLDNSKENAAVLKKSDNRKTEKMGLVGFILSFFGIIPLIGIPFGILAIIFGAKSLTKIKRNPEKYKGKGFAIASIAIGAAMLVINIAIVASSIKSINSTPAPSIDTSSMGGCWV
jgi:prolipoprotein diacylglyceryltransferase